MDDSLAMYDRCLAVHPSFIDATYRRAMTLLATGRLSDGWRAYESRFEASRNAPCFGRFSLPFWRSENLAGKHLLVWTEQGPGDEILMGTLLPDLKALAGRVTLLCSPRMVPVFRRTFPDYHVFAYDDGTKALSENPADLQASFSHLGMCLRPSMTAFSPDKYLVPDTARVESFRSKYAARAEAKPLVPPDMVQVDVAQDGENPGREVRPRRELLSG